VTWGEVKKGGSVAIRLLQVSKNHGATWTKPVTVSTTTASKRLPDDGPSSRPRARWTSPTTGPSSPGTRTVSRRRRGTSYLAKSVKRAPRRRRASGAKVAVAGIHTGPDRVEQTAPRNRSLPGLLPGRRSTPSGKANIIYTAGDENIGTDLFLHEREVEGFGESPAARAGLSRNQGSRHRRRVLVESRDEWLLEGAAILLWLGFGSSNGNGRARRAGGCWRQRPRGRARRILRCSIRAAACFGVADCRDRDRPCLRGDRVALSYGRCRFTRVTHGSPRVAASRGRLPARQGAAVVGISALNTLLALARPAESLTRLE